MRSLAVFIGLPEKLAAIALLLWILTDALIPDSWGSVWAMAALVLTTSVVGVRWARRGVRRAIWSLRGRLLLSYLFIAVVPVLLLFSLGWIGARYLAGQTAVYLVASELDRTIDQLNGSAGAALRAGAGEQTIPATRLVAFLAFRHPDIRLLYTRAGAPSLVYPPGLALMHPPSNAPSVAGILVKEERLWIWAHQRNATGEVTVMVPLTKQVLAHLVPDLGEIGVTDAPGLPGSERRRMRLQNPTPVEIEQTAAAGVVSALAEPANWMDMPVQWAATQEVYDWEDPSRTDKALLSVNTRISQVYRVIFSRRTDWDQPLLLTAFYALVSISVLIGCVALSIGISISRAMTGAFQHLYTGTQRVQAGDFSTRIPLQGDDQVAALASSFNSMTEHIERLLVVAKEKERLQADLDIGREVQEQLYPRTVPPSQSLQLTAKLKPARSVSGDYYDYQRVDSRHIAFALGDVAGKGISAAILMANVQSTLRSQIRYTQESGQCCSTSAVVSQLNKHLHAHTTPEKYATFFFGIYDEETNVLTYTNAGHLSPLLLRGNEVHSLDTNGMVVGVLPMAKYDESSIKLEKGDLLVLYTDGLTEPENEYDEMFGEDRLIEVIKRVSDRRDEEIMDEVFHAVEQWIHAPDSNDDMTMLLVRRIA